MSTNPLVGKTIRAIAIANDKESIRFELSDGQVVVANCGADCCSSTWVEHIELPALGLPATVTAVEDIGLHLRPTVCDQEFEGKYVECLQFYGCKITTHRGEIVIDYRNESNGYYGGWLDWRYET